MIKLFKYTKGDRLSFVPTIEHGMDSLKYAMGFDGPKVGYFATVDELRTLVMEAINSWDEERFISIDAYVTSLEFLNLLAVESIEKDKSK